METLYYNSNVLNLSYDASSKIGRAIWSGFLSSQEFRENGLRCAKLVDEQKLTRWLADQRTMRAIRQQDLQWVVEEVVPKLLSSSLRRMAIIVSGDIFNNMAMEQLFKRAGSLGDLVIKEFDNEEMALDWLLKPIPEAHQV